ncbi:DUF4159 domain-containing protein [Rhizobium sp. L1K21]|uniref:DUF4159 domain-containing protein n=1 Tax=Rhizobium sp. L1K21 TaxID=2954933 RepID=UPI00209257E4|nr:DUF4159 domain-containing protein [Rhizobium sp. L1K21]MCO6185427.1 DUF4159 domain-containing protein [Rhizobium sp. L1K21]
MGAFAFTAPWLLVALIAIPAIWLLLRLTPPRPRREVFPPLAILSGVLKPEETPATSPWWLTLLRMLLATLAILAMAGPVLNPNESTLSSTGPLVLLVDNDWASAPEWEQRIETAKALVAEAEDKDIPVSVAFTANAQNDATAGDARAAIEKLDAARPQPLPAKRETAIKAISEALGGTEPGTFAFVSSGVAAQDEGVGEAIAALKPQDTLLIEGDAASTVALTSVRNTANSIEINAARLSSAEAQTFQADALDTKGRVIASGTLSFGAGSTETTGSIEAPFELRNDFARVVLRAEPSAATTYLLDDAFKRRRVGLLSGEARDLAQPLLSPLYYIRVALSPYADISEPDGSDFLKVIPRLIEEKPSVIVMADIGRLPDEAYPPLENWIENGGTLIRFAGPRLASAPTDDPLVPIRLRQGERTLSGAMSWSEPQPLAPFTRTSPFFGLPTPKDVLINRQVLAEPSPDLEQNTWASLADGTPFVTGKKVGSGNIILFHTSAEATWSNLTLSGSFVEMLRRLVQLSSSTGGATQQQGALPPYRLLDANGQLTTQTGAAKALPGGDITQTSVSIDNPPGLYGSEDGFRALNLFSAGAELKPLDLTGLPALRQMGFTGSDQVSLRSYLLIAAFLLLIADSIAVLVTNDAIPRPRRSISTSAAVVLAIMFGMSAFHDARADDRMPGDEKIMAAVDETHFAYVLTGENTVDDVSHAGLQGLSEFISYRTALEPGEPIGVNPETDDLVFYPFIYWPVTSTAPVPSPEAISRIGAYMRSGGTVIFDTRDQYAVLDGTTGANGRRLQDILSNLDIPPLEPVPADHVLTKSFYLLQDFPGRYTGSPLWVEAAGDASPSGARQADGVSSILITGNDFAGAWAVDDQGYPLLPMSASDGNQREMAYRTGVNIIMYMLTGNYKSDQVHVPALLERLGQ